uniref:Reverse transcriptase Ty1/copia-type domain-containing protein n=1 Tax=Cannabis sativa TaxID=3483 RepID=A0A803Q5F0_CANSA
MGCEAVPADYGKHLKITVWSSLSKSRMDDTATLIRDYTKRLNLHGRLHEAKSMGDSLALGLESLPAESTHIQCQGSGRGGYNRGGNNSGRGRGGRSNGPKPTCQVCGRYGHSAAICYNRYDEAYMGSDPKTGGQTSQKNSQGAAAYTAAPEIIDSEAWFVDSGASNHVTADENNMTQKNEYEGYNESYRGYKCLSTTGRVYISRNVVFNEREFPFHTGFLNTYAPEKHIVIQNESWSQLPNVHFEQHSQTTLTQPVLHHLKVLQLPHQQHLQHSSVEISVHQEPKNNLQDIAPVSDSADTQSAANQLSGVPSSRVTSSHPMITRARAGIFKPKTYINQAKWTPIWNNDIHLSKFVQQLDKCFTLKDLGDLHFFLGIEVFRDETGLYLTQTKYIEDLLRRHNMTHLKPSPTPISTGKCLSALDGKEMENPTVYRSLIGALQYLCHTRPDISYAVNSLSQFLKSPSTIHWNAAKRILRYLKGTSTQGLHICCSNNLNITGFSDADWASNVDDRRYVGGYCVYLGESLVSWSSKKQSVVSRSSTESEYRALAHVSAEITWIESLLKEIKFPLPTVPITWCDNLSASALASNPMYHARTKHIELDIHYV